MDVIIYQVDAFTDKPFGGNPAGVVPDARGLGEKEMQKIAMEMNLSETAFVFPKDSSNFDIRFFTPKCEVDLCGHATIATFYTLAHKGYIEGKDNGIVRVYQNTNLGKLPVEIFFKDGEVDKVLMHQDKPKHLDTISDIDMISKSLNIETRNIGFANKDLKPEIVYTGLADVIIPVKSKSVLDNLDINLKMISELSKKVGAIGFHVFTEDENSKDKFWCRNFAPLVGIDEESATGTSNGALLYYLKRNNLLDNNKILAMQGQSLDRPSAIYCELEEKESEVTIKVGGKAVIVIEGVLSI